MFFEELEVGQSFRGTWTTVTEAHVVMFGSITGDLSPGHMNEEFMSRGPYGTRIAHGMLTASIAVASVYPAISEHAANYLGCNFSFRDPVMLGDTVKTACEIVELTRKSKWGLMRLKLTTTNQNGKTVEQLSSPFVVAVEDPQGLPVPGVSVSWAVTGGGGTLSPSSSQTNAQGRTSVSYTPGPSLGVNTVAVSTAGPAPIIFTSQITVMLIRLQGTAFIDPTGGQNSQAAVTVAVGDTIEWVNTDPITHTITSNIEPAGGAAFNSGIVGNGARFRFIPGVTGAWKYFCQVHPLIMSGATITVQ